MAKIEATKKNIEIWKVHAKKLDITLQDYTELCVNYFSKKNIDPRKEISNQELRNIFISFIRTQEENFHLKNLKINQKIIKEHNGMRELLNDISFDIKHIKTRK